MKNFIKFHLTIIFFVVINVTVVFAQKDRASDYRIIASYSQRVENFGGATSAFADSTNYRYVGTRGGNLFSEGLNFNDKIKIGETPKLYRNELHSNSAERTSDVAMGTIIPTLNNHSQTKEVKTFDANNNHISSTTFDWNATTVTWDSVGKKFCNYDNANLPLDIHLLHYNSATLVWDTTFRQQRVYTNGNCTEETITYIFIQSNTRNSTRFFRAYDASNRLIQEERTVLNTSTNLYEKMNLKTTFYGVGTDTTVFNYWYQTNNTYLPLDRYIKKYNALNLFANAATYAWDAGNNIWETVPTHLDSAFYDPSNLLMKFTVLNVPTNTSSTGLEYSRDAQGRITEVIENGLKKSEYFYDGNDNIIKKLNYTISGNTWLHDDNEERFYYELYNNATDVNSLSNNIQFVSIYPNPTSSNSYISYTSPTNEPLEIALRNMLGHKIYSVVEPGNIGDHLILLPNQNISSGFYLVELSQGSTVIKSLKFVKQ
jgi:YD repeat-containing protein